MRDIYFLYNYLSRYNLFFRKELTKVLSYHEYGEEQLLQRKNELFLKLIDVAYTRSPFYRRHYDKHGVDIKQIKSFEDIRKLPRVTKEDIRLHEKDIKLEKLGLTIKGYTSGTSGTPLTVYRDYPSVIKENAYIWAHRVMFGHFPHMKAISLRGDLDTKTREKFDPFTNTLYLSSYQLNEDTIDWYYAKIAAFQPHAMYSYPSSIETLCNLFESKNYHLKINFIFTSSETVYDFQRAKASAVLGASIVDWYGNAERSVALEQIREGTYREAPLYSINEFFDDHLLTTGLINYVFPLIRYEVDDIIHTQKTCDGLEVVDIQGRKDDYLVFADGTKIGRMSGTLKGVQHVKYTQFVQDELCSFVVNIVPAQGFCEEDENLLKEKIKSKVGSVSFNIKKVDESEIKRTKAGKYKLIINNFSKREIDMLV